MERLYKNDLPGPKRGQGAGLDELTGQPLLLSLAQLTAAGYTPLTKFPLGTSFAKFSLGAALAKFSLGAPFAKLADGAALPDASAEAG